jgi:hypothetical protein
MQQLGVCGCGRGSIDVGEGKACPRKKTTTSPSIKRCRRDEMVLRLEAEPISDKPSSAIKGLDCCLDTQA